jgi:hypothetical protein
MTLQRATLGRRDSGTHWLAGIVLACAGLVPAVIHYLPTQEKTALEYGQIVWSAEAQEHKGTDEFLFILDPLLGLMDIDSHQITDDGWEHVRSPGPDYSAKLIAHPSTNLKELQKALEALSDQGGFKKVVIFVQPL